MWGSSQGPSVAPQAPGARPTFTYPHSVVRVPVRQANDTWKAPLCLWVAMLVCTLSPGRPAMAAVTGLFVLIKHTAKAITTYIERNSWDHFSFQVSCARGGYQRVYRTHSLPCSSSALCLVNVAWKIWEPVRLGWNKVYRQEILSSDTFPTPAIAVLSLSILKCYLSPPSPQPAQCSRKGSDLRHLHLSMDLSPLLHLPGTYAN